MGLCLQVKGVILDPSCSGSGTVVSRMDHLLPGTTSGSTVDEQEQQRVEQLAKFQVGMLAGLGAALHILRAGCNADWHWIGKLLLRLA